MLLLLGFLLSSGTLAASTLVKGTRTWVSPDYTRVVFDISKQADYHLFTLHNPERVVIDIKDANWSSMSDRGIEAKGYVKNLRSARKSDALRVVLDASEKVKPKSFLLRPNKTYGHRLVVDLYPQQKGPVKAVKSANTNSKYRDVIIAIDAGHGGEDPGAIGRRGTKEKHITLSVAKKLATKINAQKESDEIYSPSMDVQKHAHIRDYDSLYKKSIEKREEFWADEASKLSWYKKWNKVLDSTKKPFYKWFTGGKINIVYNAIDRHLASWRRNKLAIIWEG